jgi:protease-4
VAERKHPIIFGLAISSLVVLGFAFLLFLFAFFLREDSPLRSGSRIGVVLIRGVILDSKGPVEQIKKFRKDERVKALIIRIDSPGGSTAASQEIHREILRTLPKKKIVVSMGNIAASGGYYIAAAADKIVANPGTLTGSIGVIMQFSNLKALLHKIGVGMEVVKSGSFKDIGSPLRDMKPEERQLLEGVIKNVHGQFIEVVAQGRRLPKDQVAQIADGRIFSGEQAKTLGLVDELGSFEDAVDLVKKMVGLSGEVKLVQAEKKKFSIWEFLFSELAGEVKQTLQEPWSSPHLLLVPPYLYKN